MAVFRRLPIDQYHIRLIHLEEASLGFVQGPGRTGLFIVGSDFVGLQRRHLFPPQPAKLSGLQVLPTGHNIAESEVTPLSGHVIGPPIVVHHIGKNRAPVWVQLRRPFSAHDIAQGEEFRILGDNRLP